MRTLLQRRRRAITALLGVGAALCLLGAGLAHAESYRYDPAGRLTQAAYSDGTTVGFVYDTRGNLLTRLASAAGTDSDGDGLADSVETGTGTFVDAGDTGTNPLVADTDGDGAEDGEEVVLGFDPLDAASTPAPVAAPALSPPSLTLLAIILAAVAFAGIRSRQRSSRPDRARSAFGWWVALAAASGALSPEPAAATCGEMLNSSPGSWSTTNVVASSGSLTAIFSSTVGFGSAEQTVDLSAHAGLFGGAGTTTANLSFTLQTATAGFGGFNNQVEAFVEYDFRNAANVSLLSGSRSVTGTTTQSFNIDIGDVPSGTTSVTVAFAAGYSVFFMAGTEAKMFAYSLVISGIDTSECGDSNVECAEECDAGALNSDVAPDACRTSCQLPSCGDGVVDSGEACDGAVNCTESCEFEAPSEEAVTSSAFAQSATIGDPINTLTGELVKGPIADLVLGGPAGLAFVRDYASERSRSASPVGALGRGWLHNFEMSLDDSSGDAEISFLFGRPLSFSAGASGWELQSPKTPFFQLVDDGADRVLLNPESSRSYRFDSTGALISVVDRNGNTLTLTYAGDILTGISDGLGRTLSLNYDGEGNLDTVSDGTRTVNYQVDGPGGTSPGDLTAASNAAVETTLYTTDGEGRITSHEEPVGNTPYSQTYDGESRASLQTSARAADTSIAYGATSTVVTDALGGTQSDSYDAEGNLTQRVDTLGGTATLAYDAKNRRTSLTNPEANVTTYAYDVSSGFLATLTRPDGAATTYTYTSATNALGLVFHDVTRIDQADGSFETFTTDASGNVTSHTGRTGEATSFTHNARGQLTLVTNVLGATTSFTYNADATLASTTTDAGDTTTYGYDALGRLTSQTLPGGDDLAFGFDSVDRLTGVTDHRGASAGTLYDTNGRPVSVTDRMGNTATLAWDAMNQLVSLTNPLGQTLTASYDNLERLADLTNAAGETVTYGRDAAGRVTSTTDSGGEVWNDSFDDAGFLVSSTTPEGRTTQYQRDAVGRVTRRTSPLGFEAEFGYDAMGRLTAWTDPLNRTTQIHYSDGGHIASTSLPGGIATTSYSYNALDQVTQFLDPAGNTWAFAYDNQGRLTGSTDPLGREASLSLDARNRVSEATFPGGIGSVAFSYDPNGNLIQALYSDTTDVGFAHDALDRLISADGITRSYDAAGRLAGGNGLTFTHDAAGRLETVTYAPGKTVTYAYDSRGLLASVTDWQGAAITLSWHPDGDTDSLSRSNGVDTTWTYDNDRRVTNIAHGALAGVALAYDAAGQMTSATRTGPQSGASPAPATATQTFDAASQLVGVTHDTLGRQTQDGGRTYAWNLASRLTSVSEGGTTTSFEYDGLGRRTQRSEDGVTRSYVWNDAVALPSVAIESEDGSHLRYYIHAPDGTLLYSIEASDDSRRYYHFDETGNTTLLSNEAGTVLASYAYGPYGDVQGVTPGIDNPYTWQGQMGVAQEEDSGLYYARARWYDSARARFLSRDPATTLGARGSNPYLYAFANPLSFSDPSGLYPAGPDTNWLGSIGSMSGSSASDAARWLFRQRELTALSNTVSMGTRGWRSYDADGKIGPWQFNEKGAKFNDARIKWGKYSKYAGKLATALDVGGGIFTAMDEYANDTRQRTTWGKGINAIGVGAIDTAMGINPATGLATLVSYSVDNLVIYTFGDEYRPGLHEVLYNTGRLVGALAEDLVHGGGATWRLADDMSSGKLGGFTKGIARVGETIGEAGYAIYSWFAGEKGPEHVYP